MVNKISLALALGALLAATGVAMAQSPKRIAISTIVEVPALVETKDGIIQALAARGFTDGKNLSIDYQNANGAMPTQQQIAKKFVGDAPDVIVAITTPTAQAMASATKSIPLVFATVTDPIKAKLVTAYTKTGTNITGVSDAAPLPEQIQLMLEILPKMKKVGFIYNPGLDNAVSTLEALRGLLKQKGIEIVESPSPTTNEVILAAKKLVGKVDAIYVPNDTTVVSALETIVKIGQETQTPVFAGETGAVARGVIGSVGLDYVAVGRVAGNMVADILGGKLPGDIDPVLAYKVLTNFQVAINRGSAQKMGVTVPESVLKRATKLID
ncbi:MAG: ABC transporter substrate-binding protein [Burkholderiaceae bacterium]